MSAYYLSVTQEPAISEVLMNELRMCWKQTSFL